MCVQGKLWCAGYRCVAVEWFGVEVWCVGLLETGLNAEYGMGSEGYVHKGADSLGKLWLAGGLGIGRGWSKWLGWEGWWGSRI